MMGYFLLSLNHRGINLCHESSASISLLTFFIDAEHFKNKSGIWIRERFIMFQYQNKL